MSSDPATAPSHEHLLILSVAAPSCEVFLLLSASLASFVWLVWMRIPHRISEHSIVPQIEVTSTLQPSRPVILPSAPSIPEIPPLTNSPPINSDSTTEDDRPLVHGARLASAFADGVSLLSRPRLSTTPAPDSYTRDELQLNFLAYHWPQQEAADKFKVSFLLVTIDDAGQNHWMKFKSACGIGSSVFNLSCLSVCLSVCVCVC